MTIKRIVQLYMNDWPNNSAVNSDYSLYRASATLRNRMVVLTYRHIIWKLL